jgi:hypothetical protein
MYMAGGMCAYLRMVVLHGCMGAVSVRVRRACGLGVASATVVVVGTHMHTGWVKEKGGQFVLVVLLNVGAVSLYSG